MASSGFVHQNSLTDFFDGIGWLMQIVMFLMLGLLVLPGQILEVAGKGLVIALILILLARPLSVFLSLMFSSYKRSAKMMVSWVGLRGAVPIILATFPLVAGVQNADYIFSIVFFVVITSVAVQGTTIPLVATYLKVTLPYREKTRYPIQYDSDIDTKSALKEVIIEATDPVVGKKIVDLHLPDNVLIVLIHRDRKFIVPRGVTILESDDKLLLLANTEDLQKARRLLKST